ncbi:unnamed protein product [Schistosoma curassoni]|nr:unnamed protein product [Schistosoma curassoni]
MLPPNTNTEALFLKPRAPFKLAAFNVSTLMQVGQQIGLAMSLKTGLTMAFSQSYGNRHWVMNKLKHTLKGFAMKSASSLSNLGCISSDPVDLPISSLFSRPKTSSSLMVT